MQRLYGFIGSFYSSINVDGVLRNSSAARAKIHENKMTIRLNTSGFYFMPNKKPKGGDF
jgi:hypothetical protein